MPGRGSAASDERFRTNPDQSPVGGSFVRDRRWRGSDGPWLGARLTSDVDVVYERSRQNIDRLAHAFAPLAPYLRGAPPGLPFRFDADTIRRGLNFTLTTDAGNVDVLGEIAGIGDYAAVLAVSEDVTVYGETYRCINLDALIVSKRAAGRAKDLEAIAELELIRDERLAGGG